jgi:hypothetical protein
LYKEVWIGLGGTHSAVYATEVSLEEYLAYTTEETEKMEVMQLAAELDGNVELAIKRIAEARKFKSIIINQLKINKMKKIMLMVCTVIMLAVTPSAKAQFVVTDPANLASGILNSANEIIQTSSTVSNVVKNFKEVEKVYKQGKEYYDKLKAVNNLVKDARKVQQTVLLVGDVSEMYVQNFGKMMNDPNFHNKNCCYRQWLFCTIE